MQTERVTFLTSRAHKKSLDAYAKRTGHSVGHVLREASQRYIAGDPGAEDAKEAELEALVEEANKAIPEMAAKLDDMSRMMREAHEEIDSLLRQAGIRK